MPPNSAPATPKTETAPRLPAMFARYKASIQQELTRAIPTANGNPNPDRPNVQTLLQYHLGWLDQHGQPAPTTAAQGKALRPTLCMFACEALSPNAAAAQAAPAAAALELIHNFSLLHDDIQDQDLERRHRPTAWSLWGVPKALVAGNALQSTGDLALLQVATRGIPPETSLKVSALLTTAYIQMIEGQCLDLDFESRTSITTQEYLQMIACKTGALIRCGLETGALLAGAPPPTVQAFAHFGDGLGQAFQIRDDYLGIWGNEATLGKATGNDIRRRKKSYPVVYALEKAAGPAQQDLQRIYAQPQPSEPDVQRVLAILDQVGARQQSQNLTEAAARRALNALDPIPLPQWAKTEAGELVDFLSRREY